MGNGSLMLWTHNMKGIDFNENFVVQSAPKGTQGQPAVTINAGVTWGELYDAVFAHNHTIVGMCWSTVTLLLLINIPI